MKIVLLIFGLAVVAGVPCKNKNLEPKLDDGIRYQYVQGGDGKLHLVDLWNLKDDISPAVRYNPDAVNTYHLFTRDNPSISQPLLLNNDGWLTSTNYNSSRRTVLLIHGWLDTVTADFNTVLVPAFLEKEDLNVIVVDWSHGAGTINYPIAVINTPVSGEAVARFVTWLNKASGSDLKNYHIVGHGLGAHQAGIVGRRLGGGVAYITALDAAFAGWLTHDDRFKATDAVYTEVIHTNAGLLGFLAPLGDVDFYPNGGVDMPGCISQECDHNRSFFYMAESVRTGGFAGTRCSTFVSAMAGQCFLWGSLNMGGVTPKTGQTGIYYLRTNAFPPFSRG
ncbi:pancreatic lipase-related protein 2-like [Helicoverpa zea]|uniref:pancreatic lipase-related protein 2-like n=1 Tax=Helicoverpa zea TaxID=7113 RepID=UPI001F578651|nr:pancreatic lipase-related protein 2-like [Helicoverpa zea]